MNNIVDKKVMLEAVSKDISLNPRGKEFKVTVINDEISNENTLSIINREYIDLLNNISVEYRMLILDKNNKIIEILDSNKNDNLKLSNNCEYIIIATGEKIESVKNYFSKSDVVKLRVDGEIISINELVDLIKHNEQIIIKNEDYITTIDEKIKIHLEVINIDETSNYKLFVKEVESDINKKEVSVFLEYGVNYIDIVLKKDDEVVVKKSIIVYRRKNEVKLKENILWLDQFPSALKLNSVEDIDRILKQVKEFGFTACSIDVKGPEGYSSYKKNDLTNSPYISNIKVTHKKGMKEERDFFQDFIDGARKYGLKVYAAINVMTEGNLIAGDHPIIDKNEEWEEVLQRPEDLGKLLPVRQSKANNILLYINPANDNAIKYEIKRFEEVIKNYDVDGVVLDRCRYDNKFADFSDMTKDKFSKFLEEKGKELRKWPDDVFKINEDGTLIEGIHYIEWWTFRSLIINNVAKAIRGIVDKYSKEKSKKIELASYVGSWYDVIYENGINWADKNFRYNSRLGFAEERIYTDEYYNTSYIENLDFIMIGTYYKTRKEVAKHITLGNILLNEEIPMLAGMSLPDLETSDIRDEVYNIAMEICEGTMTFDLSYVNFK